MWPRGGWEGGREGGRDESLEGSSENVRVGFGLVVGEEDDVVS